MEQPLLGAVYAMNCRFEIILNGQDRDRLGAVSQEVLDEIRAVERHLSFFSPQSEISRLNRWASDRPVKIQLRVFRLIERCRALWTVTRGAFDPTVGPLLQVWGWYQKKGRKPPEDERRAALSRVGMNLLELDREKCTVRFLRRGVSLNMGSVGKGFALDEVAGILREHGVESAFLHGGTSSAMGLSGRKWPVAIAHPLEGKGREIAVLSLHNRSLGVSGTHRNTLSAGGQTYGHVVDPRTGTPVDGRLMAAVVTRSATDADALSTALLCEGEELVRRLEIDAALCLHRDGRVWQTGLDNVFSTP